MGRHLNLTLLAPDIAKAILTGREPDGLSLEKLHRLPMGWEEQRRVLGMGKAGSLPALGFDPRNIPYSDWELKPVFGRLNLESPRGILAVSLSSDGLQKSDGNREREAERGILCFQNKLATASGRPMVPEGENAQNGATDARIGGTRGRVKIERMARHRFDHR